MGKVIKRIFSLLPESLRLHIIRSKVQIPSGIDNIVLKIADTQEELEQAYRLLHDSYVGQKLMDVHPSNMRFNIWSALPYTSVVIAKIENEVVGTVSLICDSPVQLPADKIFLNENNYFRSQKQRLVEASAFAVNPKYRQSGHKISLYLMKYLYQYTSSILKADLLIATVRVSAVDFYKALFAFSQNGKNTPHTFVKGAKVGHISMSLKADHAEKVKEIYSKYPDSSNLHSFCTSPESCSKFQFPNIIRGFSTKTILTPDMLEYFLVKKTGLHKELKPRELSLIHSAYDNDSSLAIKIPALDQVENIDRISFRHLTQIHAIFKTETTTIMGTIMDLSSTGAYFSPSEKALLEKNGTLYFSIQNKKFKIPCQIVWTNTGSAIRYPEGVGLKIESSENILNEVFSEFKPNTDHKSA